MKKTHTMMRVDVETNRRWNILGAMTGIKKGRLLERLSLASLDDIELLIAKYAEADTKRNRAVKEKSETDISSEREANDNAVEGVQGVAPGEDVGAEVTENPAA